jgi:hypothetical protein
MKTTNALVTYTDLTTMGLVAKGTPATGNRIATKSFINSNYYVNQSASPYNTYASLRCPPYQSIIAGFTNSGTMYYSSVSTEPVYYTGFSTSSSACSHILGGSVTVYWNGTFGNGTVIYLDADGINQFEGGGYFSLGGYSFQTDVNAVYGYTICNSFSYLFTATIGSYPCGSDLGSINVYGYTGTPLYFTTGYTYYQSDGNFLNYTGSTSYPYFVDNQPQSFTLTTSGTIWNSQGYCGGD